MTIDISAEKVKELREKSGAGIMDCKKALAASSGDLNRAIEYLRKEGVVKAAKKAGRITLEGLVAMAHSPDRASASLVEVNCETDFVARTDQFQEFVASVAERIVQEGPRDLTALLGIRLGTESLQTALSQLIAKVGENMGIRRFRLVQAGPGEKIGSYLHAGSKIGVLVRLKGEKIDEVLCRDLAMHVAAMVPHTIDRKSVPADLVEKEREIARSAPEVQGKPAAILEKIVEGKLARFYSEVCLLEQPFVKDPTGKQSVGEHLKGKIPEPQILEFARFQVGEEMA